MKFVTYGLRRLKRILDPNRAHTWFVRRRFRKLASVLDRRVEIKNPQCMSIGSGVVIRPYVWLCAMVNDLPRIGVFNPSITIENGVCIGRFCHITISNSLVIHENALITEGVLITDTIHGFSDPDVPIIRQPLRSLGPIEIGAGSWICNGARIVGRVKIGRNSVVGANTYVDRDVPDHCVVAGSPPRIIKRYDPQVGDWIDTDAPLPRSARTS
ncbi:MAG: acyltransferase [Isosphaeraceae bacterium]